MSTLRVTVSCGGRGPGHEPSCRSAGSSTPNGLTDGDVLSTGDPEYPDGRLTSAARPGRVAGQVNGHVGDLAGQAFRVVGRTGLPRVDTLARTGIDSRVEVSASGVDTMPIPAEDASFPRTWGATRPVYPQLLDPLIETAAGRVGTAPRRTGGNPR